MNNNKSACVCAPCEECVIILIPVSILWQLIEMQSWVGMSQYDTIIVPLAALSCHQLSPIPKVCDKYQSRIFRLLRNNNPGLHAISHCVLRFVSLRKSQKPHKTQLLDYICCWD